MESLVQSLVRMDFINNLYLHITHLLVYGGLSENGSGRVVCRDGDFIMRQNKRRECEMEMRFSVQEVTYLGLC